MMDLHKDPIARGLYLYQYGLAGFHPQMVFLPNLIVNLRACLCGVVNYASAQALERLDLGQKSSFLDWKHQRCPSLITIIYGRALADPHDVTGLTDSFERENGVDLDGIST